MRRSPQARSPSGHSRGVLGTVPWKRDLRWLWRQDSKDVRATCKSHESASAASSSRATPPVQFPFEFALAHLSGFAGGEEGHESHTETTSATTQVRGRARRNGLHPLDAGLNLLPERYLFEMHRVSIATASRAPPRTVPLAASSPRVDGSNCILPRPRRKDWLGPPTKKSRTQVENRLGPDGLNLVHGTKFTNNELL